MKTKLRSNLLIFKFEFVIVVFLLPTAQDLFKFGSEFGGQWCPLPCPGLFIFSLKYKPFLAKPPFFFARYDSARHSRWLDLTRILHVIWPLYANITQNNQNGSLSLSLHVWNQPNQMPNETVQRTEPPLDFFKGIKITNYVAADSCHIIWPIMGRPYESKFDCQARLKNDHCPHHKHHSKELMLFSLIFVVFNMLANRTIRSLKINV